jgi:succinate dehydrogenase/fumarate reductase flavoprotein subunit
MGALRAGVAERYEFVSSIPKQPARILMTEGCRGEGGYLLNKGERFMKNYVSGKKV